MRKLIMLVMLGAMLVLSTPLAATHIVGGSLDVTRIGNTNTYSLRLRVLRDCINGQADFDIPATVGMFDKATHELVEVFNLRNPIVENLSIVGPGCAPIPSSCTEMGTYVENITLSPQTYRSTNGYYLSYMRCCRNKIIVNISQPEDAAIAIYTEIPPLSVVNSTPRFNNNPFTFLCTNNVFNYNFEFADPDGDSLVYTLITPLNGPLTRNNPRTNNPPSGPYDNITWLPGYSENVQVEGNPGLIIDRRTGEVEMNPVRTGVHVCAFKVEEYRFGQKLGEVRLELQFTIISCPPNPAPAITIRNESGQAVFSNTLTVITPQKICIDIEGTDPTDSVTLRVSSNAFFDSTKKTLPTITRMLTVGNKFTTTKVCWQTDCEYTSANTISLVIEASDNGCPLPRKSRRTVTLNVIPMPLQNSVDILCFNVFENSIFFEYGDSNPSSPYFNKYFLFRSKNNEPFLLYDSIADKQLRAYLDSFATDCRTIDYRYFIRAQNNCGFYGPTSDTQSTFANLLAIPPIHPIQTVTVVDNTKLHVYWPRSNEPDFSRYSLYKKKRNESDWTFVRDFITQNTIRYEDEDVDVSAHSYCYYVLVRDTCLNIGPPGKPACSIVLNGNSKPFEHTLTHLDYSYWTSGLSTYRFFRQSHITPFELIASQSTNALTYLDDKLDTESGWYQYYVEATERQQQSVNTQLPPEAFIARSNTIELIQKPIVYAPNAFSVNSDGVNDEFNLRDIFVKDFNLKVYNRWGQMVYETSDKNARWNGTTPDGSSEPLEVYVYVITYTGWDNTAHTLSGNVTLLR